MFGGLGCVARVATSVGVVAASSLLTLQPASAAETRVIGYYDMSAGEGVASQVRPIKAAGAKAVKVVGLTRGELAGLDALVVQNPDNSAFGEEYLANVQNVNKAVRRGMELLVHDREVGTAESILPRGASFDIVRDFADDADVDVLNDKTLVTRGPGGVVTDSTLDGGNSSSHGYTVEGTLPRKATRILSRGNPAEIVAMCYPHGSGSVYYSSIPLDYYLDQPDYRPNFARIYAPNVMAYGAQGACSRPPQK